MPCPARDENERGCARSTACGEHAAGQPSAHGLETSPRSRPAADVDLHSSFPEEHTCREGPSWPLKCTGLPFLGIGMFGIGMFGTGMFGGGCSFSTNPWQCWAEPALGWHTQEW